MSEPAGRILAIDDEAVNRELLELRLSQQGYEVSLAASGEEALDRLARQPFDAVLLDLMMPGMDGLEVLRRARQRWSALELPILVVTARDAPEEIAQGLDLGANDYVLKPIDFAILLARIRTQIGIVRTERMLRETQSRFSDLFDNASDLICSLSPPGHLRLVNRTWRETLGPPPGPGEPPQHILDLVHPESGPGLEEALQRVLAGERVGPVTAQLKAQTGEWLEVEGELSPRREGGRPVAVRCILRDVTERNRIEQLKSQFISIVSHELRTPLTAVEGALRLITSGVSGAVSSDVTEMLDSALAASDRLSRIIESMLDLQRVEAGQLELTLEEVDPLAVAREMGEALALLSESRQVKIRVKGSGPAVQADARRLRTILQHLLRNAVEASPAGAEVTATARADGEKVIVSVRDHGAGIPESLAPRIFGKFVRADHRGPGIGLGLALARALALRHQGRIWYESKRGQGTTFHLSLPAAGPAATSPTPAEESGRSRTISGRRLSTSRMLRVAAAPAAERREEADAPGRILLVDSTRSRSDLAGRLTREGHQVLQASTRDGTLRQVESGDLDLVLLSLVGPDLDGLALLEEIRRRHDPLALPVITIAGWDEREPTLEAFRRGANDYVPRPVNLRVLLARIRTQLSILRLQSELRAAAGTLHDLFENANDLVVLAEPDGRLVYANRRWRQVLGEPSPEEGESCALLEAVAPERRDHCRRVLTRLLDGEKVGRVDTTLLSRNGERIDVEARVSCRIVGGSPVRIRGIFRDVTEHKRIARMQDELIGLFSRQIRGPLSVLQGAIQLLEAQVPQPLPAEVIELIGIASGNVRRLDQLVRDLLDLEAIEAGGITLKLSPLSLKEIVPEVVKELTPLAGRYDVQVVLSIPDVVAWCDRQAIGRILINLVSNAIKFSGQGEKVLLTAAQERDQVVVTVQDRGPGIPETFHSQIFHRFTQADASDRRVREGSGLGLAIARGLVEAHGGRIWFESTPGAGTRFHFTLPAAYPDWSTGQTSS